MNRAETLDAARVAVLQDRAATHGDAERTFGSIAALWSVHLGVAVTAADVALMMVLLKCARASTNPRHADNWVDICGYGACGAEIATETPQ